MRVAGVGLGTRLPKLYGNPGMLGFFTHAPAVSTRLSFFESLGTRLCLPEAIFLQDLHSLHRFYHIEVLSFTITPISTFIGAFVSEIQKCLPEAICCFITRLTLFTEILSQR